MIYNYIKTVVFLAGILVLQSQGFTQVKTKNGGTIQDVDVTKEEIQREMLKYRSEVYNLIANNKATTKSQNAFWEEEEIDGVKGIDLLRKKAIDSLAAIKVQEKLLVERGLWPYKDYQSFLKDLKNTNESRRESVANAKVVYGPVEYTEQTFFDYRFANALIQLKHKLVEEKLITITEDDLENQFKKMQKTVYQEKKYTLEAFIRQVREAYIEEAYKNLINQYSQKAKRNINLAQLNQITLTN
jgi:hypothetical protein